MKRVALLIALLLTGCPGSGAPQIGPSAGPDLSRSLVLSSGKALEGGTLTLTFVSNGKPVSGVKSSLLGPTLGYGNSMNVSKTVYSPLISGDYRAIAQAPGYAVTELTGISFLPDVATQSVAREIPLAPGGTVTGRVLDQNGNPLWGARITSGLAATFSGADGRFTLEGIPQGAATIRLAKTRFSAGTRTATVAGTAQDLGDVALAAGNTGFAIYNPQDTLGGRTVAVAFAPLKAKLQASGYLDADKSQAGIWVLVAPKTLSDAQMQELQAFVSGGGKLVVFGEWGGYGAYAPDSLNRMLGNYGINVLTDLVKSSQNLGRPEWITVTGFADTPLAQGVSGIALFSAGSVFAVPPAAAVISTGPGGYRLQGMAGVDVGAAAIAGNGFVVTLGDSSAWTDDSTAGAGDINFDRQNNPIFVLNLFGW